MNLQDKLIKLYNEIDELKNKDSSSDSDFKAWKTDVQLCLSGLYGEKSIQLKNFNNRRFSPMVFGGNTDWHGPYVRDLETTKKEFIQMIRKEAWNMLQIISGKFFEDGEIVHNECNGILYSNVAFRSMHPIEYENIKINTVDWHPGYPCYVISYDNCIEHTPKTSILGCA